MSSQNIILYTYALVTNDKLSMIFILIGTYYKCSIKLIHEMKSLSSIFSIAIGTLKTITMV